MTTGIRALLLMVGLFTALPALAAEADLAREYRRHIHFPNDPRETEARVLLLLHAFDLGRLSEVLTALSETNDLIPTDLVTTTGCRRPVPKYSLAKLILVRPEEHKGLSPALELALSFPHVKTSVLGAIAYAFGHKLFAPFSDWDKRATFSQPDEERRAALIALFAQVVRTDIPIAKPILGLDGKPFYSEMWVSFHHSGVDYEGSFRGFEYPLGLAADTGYKPLVKLVDRLLYRVIPGKCLKGCTYDADYQATILARVVRFRPDGLDEALPDLFFEKLVPPEME